MTPPTIGRHLTVATDGLKQRAYRATLALDQALQVLDSRKVVGMAVGLLMHKYQLTEQAAREVLRRRADGAGVSVRELAAELVDAAEDTGLGLPPRRTADRQRTSLSDSS